MTKWLSFGISWIWLTSMGWGQISYQLELDLRKNGSSGALVGKISVTDWPGAGAKRCLYLPLNDPNYSIDPARGLSPTALKFGRNQRKPGEILLGGGVTGARFLSDYLVEIDHVTGTFEVDFQATLPKWHDADQNRWFYNDYYPVPLDSCPESHEPSFQYQYGFQNKIQVRIQSRKGWSVVAPGLGHGDRSEHAWSFIGKKLSFSYGSQFRFKNFRVGSTSVTVASFTDSFSRIQQKVEPFLKKSMSLLGPFPYESLVVLETEDLEKSLVPGIITINREKHVAKGKKVNPINWNLWQLANFIPQQWFGVTMFPEKMDEFWFHKGFADFIAYYLMLGDPEAANFFSGIKGSPLFDFSYRQAQDLVAGVLTFMHPFNALTDKSGQNLDALEDQHGFGYVRHSLGLRYLFWYLGEETFAKLVRHFMERNLFRPVVSADFYRSLENQDQNASAILLQWWSEDSWPDFYIHHVERGAANQEGLSSVKVYVGQSENFNFPVDVTVWDSRGKRHYDRAVRDGDYWVAEFQLEGPTKRVEIDPGRGVYDWDRFNNDDGDVEFNFFPGAARTIKDNAYTVLWVPLIAKLPGESFSLILAGQTFRYVNSGYTTLFSYVPEEQRVGFQGFFLTDLPKFGLFTVMRAAQDFGPTLKGERVFEAGLYRAPFIWKEPNTEVGIRLRSRQTLGHEESLHQTITYRLRVLPLNPGRCHYEVKSDLESTPGETSGGFRYQRDFLLLRTNCRIRSMDWGVRGFWGKMTGNGPIPESINFKPQNVNEARVRIDRPTLDSVRGISSVGADFLWPAKLPLPSAFFFLPRESRYRLFYDYAITEEPNKRIRDGGAGLLIPFGGNAVGKRSISILQFSILAVLYRSYDGEVDRKPGVLMDFLGKL